MATKQLVVHPSALNAKGRFRLIKALYDIRPRDSHLSALIIYKNLVDAWAHYVCPDTDGRYKTGICLNDEQREKFQGIDGVEFGEWVYSKE